MRLAPFEADGAERLGVFWGRMQVRRHTKHINCINGTMR